MKLECVPLLRSQRELYKIPRGWDRFREYLATLIDPDTSDLRLPLSAMNPMGQEPVPDLLDALLVLDAEAVAARTIEEASTRLAAAAGSFKVVLVVADDKLGGWTNRTTSEFSHRFENGAMLKRGWVTGILWTSEAPSLKAIREELLTCLFRVAHIAAHGPAKTLREMLAQEGFAMVSAGCTQPALSQDDLAYTRAVLALQLDSKDRPTVLACLFGDTPAAALGYTPQGLSERAGFALALEDARAAGVQA